MRRFLPFLALVLVACAAPQAEQQQQPGYPAGGQPPPQQYGPGGQPAPGYAQPPPAGTTPPGNVLKPQGEDEYATVEDAERALDQAKTELAALAPAKDGGKKGSEVQPLTRGTPPCANACRAFASMRRAADAVCRLAGETDARCVKARTLVKENETRVAVCGCEPPKE